MIHINSIEISLTPELINSGRWHEIFITVRLAGEAKICFRQRMLPDDLTSRFDWIMDAAKEMLREHIKSEMEKKGAVSAEQAPRE